MFRRFYMSQKKSKKIYLADLGVLFAVLAPLYAPFGRSFAMKTTLRGGFSVGALSENKKRLLPKQESLSMG